MHKVAVWWQELRTLVLALRIIAFEKTDAAALVIVSVISLPVLLALFMHSGRDGAAALLGAALLYYGFRHWARKNRFRLIRTADRIEYADVGSDEEEYRQRFATGVVLRRLGLGEFRKTGEYNADLMEGNRWFYVVSSPEKTRIIPFEWIVGIEIDWEEEA